MFLLDASVALIAAVKINSSLERTPLNATTAPAIKCDPRVSSPRGTRFRAGKTSRQLHKIAAAGQAVYPSKGMIILDGQVGESGVRCHLW